MKDCQKECLRIGVILAIAELALGFAAGLPALFVLAACGYVFIVLQLPCADEWMGREI